MDIKLDTIEKRLMNLKIYEKEISKMKHKEGKKRLNKKQKQNISEPRNNFKQSDIRTIAIPKGEERNRGKN